MGLWGVAGLTDPCIEVLQGRRESVFWLCRSRYAAIDLRAKEPIADPADDGPPKYQAAVQVIEQLSQLYEQYSSKHINRDHYVPLWTD